MKKQRLDCRMVEIGLAESREKAKALIIAGAVNVEGRSHLKPSDSVCDEAIILKARLPFASRGGLKLQKAFEAFGLDVRGLVCADIGASTGGFTDCLLKRGASLVYAIDVGFGQLDWRLRSDPRVVVLERSNARHMEPDWFKDALQFACMDVSFISARLIIPALCACLGRLAHAVILIKPQFEAGREKVGKKGVVSDPAVHMEVITSVADAASRAGFGALGLSFSPIRGPEGNIEFLLHLQKDTAGIELPISQTVTEAREQLKRLPVDSITE